jgi:hypothetical protein
MRLVHQSNHHRSYFLPWFALVAQAFPWLRAYFTNFKALKNVAKQIGSVHFFSFLSNVYQVLWTALQKKERPDPVLFSVFTHNLDTN